MNAPKRFQRKGRLSSVAEITVSKILQPGIAVVSEVPGAHTNPVALAAFKELDSQPIGTILRVTFGTRSQAESGRHAIHHWAKKTGNKVSINHRGNSLYVTKLEAKQ
jgi:hypothetical protein